MRSRELPLITRISEAVNQGLFRDNFLDLERQLYIYIQIGDNSEAMELACRILGKSPEEMNVGIGARLQVLGEIKKIKEKGK